MKTKNFMKELISYIINYKKFIIRFSNNESIFEIH